jgi:excisionase family DNA binding protein
VRGTNHTTRICDACKRDPANVDWIEAPEEPARWSIDVAVRQAMREVVREEVRLALREEIARMNIRPISSAEDAFLSISRAAEIIGVHPATIRSWVHSGQLKGHRAGRHLRVKRSELEAYASSVEKGQNLDLDALAGKLAAA